MFEADLVLNINVLSGYLIKLLSLGILHLDALNKA